jgi:hypothetical protein
MKLLIPIFSPATGTWGGLTRVVAVATAAQAAGHQVAFCASGSIEKSLRQNGYNIYSMPAATFLGLPPSLSRIVEQRSQRATLPVPPGRDFGSIWLVQLISGMARAGYLQQLVAAELAAARDFGAECMFTDLNLGAFLAAQIAGLPIAAAYQSPMAQGLACSPGGCLTGRSAACRKAIACARRPWTWYATARTYSKTSRRSRSLSRPIQSGMTCTMSASCWAISSPALSSQMVCMRRAQALGARIQSLGGAHAAVAAIERVISSSYA